MTKAWVQVSAIPGPREVYRVTLPAGFYTVTVTGDSAKCEAQCHQYRPWGRTGVESAIVARYRVARAGLHSAAESGFITPAELRAAEIELACAYAEAIDPAFSTLAERDAA